MEIEQIIKAIMSYLYGFTIVGINPFPSNEALSPQQTSTIKLRSNTLCIHAYLEFKTLLQTLDLLNFMHRGQAYHKKEKDDDS